MDLSERPDGPFQRHPWETVRGRHFRDLATHAVPPREGLRVLDVGSGDGYLADLLARAYGGAARVVGWDSGYDAQVLAGLPEPAPGVTRVRERPDGTFDLVVLLDVLEHVADDASFLRKVVDQQLVRGGHAVVSVPAWPQLATSHDTRLGHHRRYTPRGARRLLECCGLVVLRAGGLYGSLLLPRAVGRLREALRGPGAEDAAVDGLAWRGSAAAARVTEALLAADARLGAAAARAGLELPGLSWWAVCRKPS